MQSDKYAIYQSEKKRVVKTNIIYLLCLTKNNIDIKTIQHKDNTNSNDMYVHIVLKEHVEDLMRVTQTRDIKEEKIYLELFFKVERSTGTPRNASITILSDASALFPTSHYHRYLHNKNMKSNRSLPMHAKVLCVETH